MIAVIIIVRRGIAATLIKNPISISMPQAISKDATKDTSKAVPTEKVVDADATASDEQLKPSTGTTQPLETKEVVKDVSKDTTTEKPVAVKTTRKSKLGE